MSHWLTRLYTNCRERGKTDVFEVELPGGGTFIGDIKTIRLAKDNSSGMHLLHPEWLCDIVKIDHAGIHTEFMCDQWCVGIISRLFLWRVVLL